LFIRIIFTYIFICCIPANNIDYVCTYLVLASTIACVFEFLYSYILYILNKRKIILNKSNKTNYLHKILKISLPVAITSIIRSGLSTLKHSLIPLRLEKYTNSSSLALSQYGLINGMTFPVLLFPSVFINSFAGLLIPEFASMKLSNNYNSINNVIQFIFKFVSFFTICVIGIFITFTEEICHIIYHNQDIVKFMVLLSPIIIFMYLDTIIDAMLRGLDRQVEVMYCNIADLFITISLIYTLIPIYGIYGYIVILYISEIFNFSVSLYQLYKETHFNFDFYFCIIIPILLIMIIKFLFDNFDYYLTSRIQIVSYKIFIFILIYTILIFIFSFFKKIYTTSIS
jgi:stage V sporulation protein B